MDHRTYKSELNVRLVSHLPALSDFASPIALATIFSLEIRHWVRHLRVQRRPLVNTYQIPTVPPPPLNGHNRPSTLPAAPQAPPPPPLLFSHCRLRPTATASFCGSTTAIAAAAPITIALGSTPVQTTETLNIGGKSK